MTHLCREDPEKCEPWPRCAREGRYDECLSICPHRESEEEQVITHFYDFVGPNDEPRCVLHVPEGGERATAVRRGDLSCHHEVGVGEQFIYTRGGDTLCGPCSLGRYL